MCPWPTPGTRPGLPLYPQSALAQRGGAAMRPSTSTPPWARVSGLRRYLPDPSGDGLCQPAEPGRRPKVGGDSIICVSYFGFPEKMDQQAPEALARIQRASCSRADRVRPCGPGREMVCWGQTAAREADHADYRLHPQRLSGEIRHPRQSGLVDQLAARVVFESAYGTQRRAGPGGLLHIWLIWQFSQALRAGWSPTVRPCA